MVTPLGYGTITTITQAKWHSVMRKSVSWPSRWLPSPLHTVAVMREECMARRGYELLLDFWYTGINYSVDDPRCDNDPLVSATETPLLNHRTKWEWILRDVSKSLRLLAFCWNIHRNINICSISIAVSDIMLHECSGFIYNPCGIRSWIAACHFEYPSRSPK